jgi:sugar phosphate isomerase/epimerase
MYYTGFADEAGKNIDIQIKATKELGWSNIESRAINETTLAQMSDEMFEEVYEKLNTSGVKINCYGSAVANWSKDPLKEEDFNSSLDELKCAIPRMQKLNCKMIRGMSFKVLKDKIPYSEELENIVFKKVKHLVKICEDAGIIYVHENCMNYGGMSYEHTLKLLDSIKSDNFKLVFDTGNPVFTYDIRGDRPYKKQNAWEFYSNIKDQIYYVHIKDGIYIKETEEIFPESEFTYPGEGNGYVKEIVTDLIKNGYDGGFSMEPHMKAVFHDKDKTEESAMFNTYVEYGKRFMALVDSVKL